MRQAKTVRHGPAGRCSVEAATPSRIGGLPDSSVVMSSLVLSILRAGHRTADARLWLRRAEYERWRSRPSEAAWTLMMEPGCDVAQPRRRKVRARWRDL